MATGGDDFGFEDPDLDKDLDHNSDNDDEEGQEVDTTRPFQPGEASTPYHGGEQHEMQTMQHEQSGLPDTSYDETPFLERTPSISDLQKESFLRQKLKKAVDTIKGKFPKANFEKIRIRRGTGKNEGKIVAIGTKKGEYKILKDNESGFMKNFLDSFKDELGPSAEDLIAQDNESIRDERQRLREAEKQLQEAQKIASEREKAAQEVQDLRIRIERTNAKMGQLGSNVENESELRRLNQLKKNLEKDFENAKKEVAALEKQAKQKAKEQTRVDQLRASLAAKESERNTFQERLNDTRALDDLKEQEDELKRQNEEDKKIIEDENASPTDKQAAEERVAERTEELGRLQTQIAERERALPLRERIKEIFKKHGVTLTAILLAAGVTIGSVIGAITNALKATGKALGKGLSDIGSKVASALPGLIGSIAKFLFKTAGQVIGFLAEHTWLLILAVVAFLVEKYIKKRR
ncbi:uncharacterized protein LOC144658711 [Oculina patagonica]